MADLSPTNSLKVEFEKSELEKVGVDTLVVFTSSQIKGQKKDKKAKKSEVNESKAELQVEGVSKAIQHKILTSAEGAAISGSANEAVLIRAAGVPGCKNILTLGLGSSSSLDTERLRQAAATAINALKGTKSKTAAIAMDSLPHHTLDAETVAQALTEGAALANYSFDIYKEKKNSDRVEKLVLVSSHKVKGAEKGCESGAVIAECVNFSRWLGDRPGNRMTPSMLAEEAMAAAKGSKLRVNSWDKSRIKSEKMGSFLSVSLGSTQEPRFIVMEYFNAHSSKDPICFVGKGLTFDSGGISIKPSGGMEEMKYDMCGGAAVIATMLAISRLKLKVNAIGLVPATENMPGPAANKPGDIVTARNGKTIEINNTDAEGRLILADALVYACEQKPALIVDAATLTGAMVVALGNIHTGYFTRNEKLNLRIQEAADATGELVWRMPLTDFHAKDMKGTYADLSNMSSTKGAGSATAAAFLEQFVSKDIPWAHFDIAGTGWHCGDRLPYCPRKGASGAMVRTFVHLAQQHES